MRALQVSNSRKIFMKIFLWKNNVNLLCKVSFWYLWVISSMWYRYVLWHRFCEYIFLCVCQHIGPCVGITAWKVFQYGDISGPYFPAFGLNMERYPVSLRIYSECGKIRTRKNSVFGHFSRCVCVCMRVISH